MYSRVEGCQTGPRALLHAYVITRVAYEIILADFNLVVSNPTAKTAKFNSLSNFLAIRYFTGLAICTFTVIVGLGAHIHAVRDDGYYVRAFSRRLCCFIVHMQKKNWWLTCKS